MKKIRLTLEADPGVLFDKIASMQIAGSDGTQGIGVRLVSTLLEGKRSFINDVGLAIYGIDVKSVEVVETE